MAITKNAGSLFLAGATPRLLTQPNADIILSSTAPLFHTNSAGVPDTSSIIITATLISLEGTVTFGASGATLSSVSGNTAVLAFTGMTGTTATITATLTYRGNVFTKSRVISVVSDGSAVTSYTWIKYADDAVGTGISDSPVGKKYLGLGQNKTTATESNIPADYSWSLITGTDGVPGTPGADGVTLFTWIKYSDNADGTGLYDTPTSSTLYIGISPNRTTATESTLKTDYVWSKFKGDQGVPGDAGSNGSRGAGHYYATGSWTDAAADAATPGANVIDDVVTISNGTLVSEKKWTGSAWVDNGLVIDGNAIVTGSITAAKINSNGLDIRKTDGTVIISAGGLQAGFEAPGTLNSAVIPLIPSAITLTGRNVTVTGNKLTKTGGVNGNWDADAYSKESHQGGAYCSFTVPQINLDCMVGLNTDPLTDTSYGSLDFAIYLTGATVRIYQSGVDLGGFGAYVAGDSFSITHDGVTCSYRKNGVAFRNQAVSAITSPLFFDCSLNGLGMVIDTVQFGPLTSAVSGQAAYDAVNDSTTGLAQRLRANAINILGGGGAVTIGSLTVDGSGNRTGGNGVGITAKGIAAYAPSGTPTVVIDAVTGAIAVAADISGSTGTFGDVIIGTKLYSGMTAWGVGSGIWMENVGGVVKVAFGSSTEYMRWSPSAGLELKLATFSVVLSGTLASTVANGSIVYGGLITATITGGVAPFTYSWSTTAYSDGGPLINYGIYSGQGTSAAAFTGSATNNRINASITLIVTDSRGFTATGYSGHTVTHGTYIP